MIVDAHQHFWAVARGDYEWMRETIHARDLASLGPSLLASCVFGVLDPKALVAWVLEDRLPVRVQVQLHKYLWPGAERGV